MDPGLQSIDGVLIARLLEEARRSPRRRVNYNFHRTPAEDPNRFLNVMLDGTYVAPHRHLAVPKPELFLVLEGRIVLFVFDDEGRVRERLVAGAGGPEGRVGVDVAPGIWHSLAVAGPYAVVCEVKPGGYDPATDKQFAPWAPREGDPGAADYLAALLAGAPPRRPQRDT